MLTAENIKTNPFCPQVFQFFEALTLWASNGSRQIAWMDGPCGSEDEMLMNFEDAYQVVKHRIVNPAIHAEIEKFTALWDEVFSPEGVWNKDMWSNEAITHAPGWSRLRTQARLILLMIISGQGGAFITDMSSHVGDEKWPEWK